MAVLNPRDKIRSAIMYKTPERRPRKDDHSGEKWAGPKFPFKVILD